MYAEHLPALKAFLRLKNVPGTRLTLEFDIDSFNEELDAVTPRFIFSEITNTLYGSETAAAAAGEKPGDMEPVSGEIGKRSGTAAMIEDSKGNRSIVPTFRRAHAWLRKQDDASVRALSIHESARA